jgi:putative nucleotidyltransferase with HDIG domain
MAEKGATRPGAPWLRGILLYPARHVRWRIIAPFIIITLLLAAGGTYLVTRVVVTSLEERFDNQLAEASRVAADSVVRQERAHLETARAIAFTEGLAGAVERRDEAAVRRIVEPIVANDHAYIVEVLDQRGGRIFGARLTDEQALEYAPLFDVADRSGWPIVDSVLAGERDEFGDKYASLMSTPAGSALYTAGPIKDGDRVVGAVLIGTPSSVLAADLKHQSLADITLYDANGALLATTLKPEAGDAEALRPHPDVLAGGLDVPLRQHSDVAGRGFDMLYGHLTVRDASVGLYSVALPSSFVLSGGVATRTELVLLFTAATAAVLLVGWLISRTITRPVFRLVTAAHAIAAGDLSARARLRGDDEIAELGDAFDKMTERVERQHLATIRALAGAIDARDPYTLGHSLRVGQLAVEIGRHLGIDGATLHHLEVGGYLHDIGKIGVRDSVLLKPDALTPSEREAVERHPHIGLEILAPVELAPEVLEFVGAHHEKLDGSGYPAHLKADQLSIVARIATVADIYDALTTDRPYRKGQTTKEALEVLRREVAEGHLDPDAVSALDAVVERWELRRKAEASLAGHALFEHGERAA